MTPGDGHEDAALATRAAAGDERAFSMLVTRHKAGLYRFARRYAGGADDAHDVVQQSFVAAWSALDRYDPKRSFDVWLRAIALNKCRDQARRNRVRRLLLISDWGRSAQVPDPADGPEERWIADEGLRALDRAVAALPRALKEPLLLTAFEGLTHADAARQLGISAKAVETRVYRARRTLSQVLGQDSSASEDIRS